MRRPKLKLSQNDLIRYSPTEKALFELIPRNGSKIDTKTLTKLYYERQQEDIPMHGRVIVNGTVQQLIEKVRRNKEPFVIHHSGRAGPNSAEVWVETYAYSD